MAAGGLERQSNGNIASEYGLHLAYPTVAVKSNGAALVGYVYSANLTIADFQNPNAQVPTYPGVWGVEWEGGAMRRVGDRLLRQQWCWWDVCVNLTTGDFSYGNAQAYLSSYVGRGRKGGESGVNDVWQGQKVRGQVGFNGRGRR